MNAVPYMLKAKATKLAAGPDATLSPPPPVMDPLRHAFETAKLVRFDTSPGPSGVADAAPAPVTDPAIRGLAPFIWPKGAMMAVPNRGLRETTSPTGTLDPDIALWQSVIVSIWPFEGPPSEGTWPRGWMGIDNTATIYICTVAGEPGTWEAVEGGGTYPLSTPLAGAPSTYPMTDTLTTFLLTASLAVGTWALTFTSSVAVTEATSEGQITAVQGDAVATLSGCYSATIANTVDGNYANVSLTFLAEVTTAGALAFQAQLVTGGLTIPEGPSSGYVATRVA